MAESRPEMNSPVSLVYVCKDGIEFRYILSKNLSKLVIKHFWALVYQTAVVRIEEIAKKSKKKLCRHFSNVHYS